MLHIVGDNDKALFGSIGLLLLKPETQKEMGYSPTVVDGDIFSVAENEQAVASATITKSGTMKIKIIYSKNSDDFLFVVKELVKYAKEKQVTRISVTDVSKNSSLWEAAGFRQISTVGKNFIEFEMDFKNDRK